MAKKPKIEDKPKESIIDTSQLNESEEQELYDKYLEEARGLAAIDVIVMRHDGNLAMHNIRRGIKNLKAHEKLLRRMPDVDVDAILTLDEKAMAAAYAVRQVGRISEGGSIQRMLQRAGELRAIMLPVAESLAKLGLLPAGKVQQIREGAGPVDTAQDLVDLAALYRAHEKKLRGKTPFTPIIIKEAAVLGKMLHLSLRPAGSHPNQRELPDEVKEAVNLRDRMWTLVVKGHKELRRCGMWIWVDDVDSYVPPLLSRFMKAKVEETDGEAAQPEPIEIHPIPLPLP